MWFRWKQAPRIKTKINRLKMTDNNSPRFSSNTRKLWSKGVSHQHEFVNDGAFGMENWNKFVSFTQLIKELTNTKNIRTDERNAESNRLSIDASRKARKAHRVEKSRRKETDTNNGVCVRGKLQGLQTERDCVWRNDLKGVAPIQTLVFGSCFAHRWFMSMWGRMICRFFEFFNTN